MSHAEILGHIQRILGDLASAKGVRIGVSATRRVCSAVTCGSIR